MTHPHGLTKDDVAHLKAGDEATLVLWVDGAPRIITSTLYNVGDGKSPLLFMAGIFVRGAEGEPGAALVRAISPVPPTPPMEEPTWLGAVVMTDDGVAVRHSTGLHIGQWVTARADFLFWGELHSPSPLTDAERREYGMPETVPPGHVAVRVDDLPEGGLNRFTHVDEGVWGSWENVMLSRVAKAIMKAQREAGR